MDRFRIIQEMLGYFKENKLNQEILTFQAELEILKNQAPDSEEKRNLILKKLNEELMPLAESIREKITDPTIKKEDQKNIIKKFENLYNFLTATKKQLEEAQTSHDSIDEKLDEEENELSKFSM